MTAFTAGSITNGLVTLRFQHNDAEFQLLSIEREKQAAEPEPPKGKGAPTKGAARAGVKPSPAVPLAATDLWKVTLFDRNAAGPENAYSIVRPSNVTVMDPLQVSVSQGVDEGRFTAVWNVTDWKDASPGSDSSDTDADGGFPKEKLRVALSARAAAGQDVCELDLETEIKHADAKKPLTSVYRLELRSGVATSGDQDRHVLAVPWYLGVLLRRPMTNTLTASYPMVADERLSHPSSNTKPLTHPGQISMQWMAFYDEDVPGQQTYFWGTRDVNFHVKPYCVYPEPKTPALACGVQYFPPGNLAESGPVSFAFPVILTAIEGDWFDAATFYRKWALQQRSWVPDKTADDPDSEFSDEVRSADLLGSVAPAPCNAGGATISLGLQGVHKDYDNFKFWKQEWKDIRSFFKVQKILGRVWYWDQDSFESNTGEWFPIRKQFLEHAPKDASMLWAPYFHPSSYCTEVKDKPGVLDEAMMMKVVDEFGVLHQSEGKHLRKSSGCDPAVDDMEPLTTRKLCHGTNDPASLQATNPLTYTLVVGKNLLSSGMKLAGLYLDEYHIGETYCYDAAHAHPPEGLPGGGTYWVGGKRTLLLRVKQALRKFVPEAYLWIEGASEPYLPLVEVCNLRYGFSSASLRDGTKVPAFQVVYNEYQRFTNNVPPVNVPPDTPALQNPSTMLSIREEFAELIYATGEFPVDSALNEATLLEHYGQNDLYDKTLDMLQAFSKVLQLQAVRDLIRFGRRLRDPLTDVQSFVTSPGVQKQAVYASAHGVPGVKVALLFVNWTGADDAPLLQIPIEPKAVEPKPSPGPQSLELTLDLADYGFAEGEYKLDLVDPENPEDPDSSEPLSFGGEPIQHPIEVPARSARLYVLEPVPTPAFEIKPSPRPEERPAPPAGRTREPSKRPPGPPSD